VMVDASGLWCGPLWLRRGLAAGFSFESFSFWTLGKWDTLSYDGMCLSHEPCSIKVCLGFDFNNRLLGCNLFWVYKFCFCFLAAEV
jgi:hypothetical protein